MPTSHSNRSGGGSSDRPSTAGSLPVRTRAPPLTSGQSPSSSSNIPSTPGGSGPNRVPEGGEPFMRSPPVGTMHPSSPPARTFTAEQLNQSSSEAPTPPGVAGGQPVGRDGRPLPAGTYTTGSPPFQRADALPTITNPSSGPYRPSDLPSPSPGPTRGAGYLATGGGGGYRGGRGGFPGLVNTSNQGALNRLIPTNQATGTSSAAQAGSSVMPSSPPLAGQRPVSKAGSIPESVRSNASSTASEVLQHLCQSPILQAQVRQDFGAPPAFESLSKDEAMTYVDQQSSATARALIGNLGKSRLKLQQGQAKDRSKASSSSSSKKKVTESKATSKAREEYEGYEQQYQGLTNLIRARQAARAAQEAEEGDDDGDEDGGEGEDDDEEE